MNMFYRWLNMSLSPFVSKLVSKNVLKLFWTRIFLDFFYYTLYHTTLSSTTPLLVLTSYTVIWFTMAVFEAIRGLSSSLKSCLELFSLSELFFGDRCKRSLIYRVLTAQNMRPWYHVKWVKIEFFIYFLMSFSVDTLKKKASCCFKILIWFFLNVHHIQSIWFSAWKKSYPKVRQGTVLCRKCLQNDLTQLK